LAAEVCGLVVLVVGVVLLVLAVEVTEAQEPAYQAGAWEVDSASVALLVDAAAPTSAASESMPVVAVVADEVAVSATLEMEAEEEQRALQMAQETLQEFFVLASLPPLRQDSSSYV